MVENLKLKKIMKAICQLVSGAIYYITLEATDCKEEDFDEVQVYDFYEVQVYVAESMTLDMFRPAICYKV